MADKAHRLTDEKLEEMEKRLSAIYSRAEKEIQKTADEYFSKFSKQDEAKRKLVEQGKITEKEYTKWRKGKVMYGKLKGANDHIKAVREEWSEYVTTTTTTGAKTSTPPANNGGAKLTKAEIYAKDEHGRYKLSTAG